MRKTKRITELFNIHKLGNIFKILIVVLILFYIVAFVTRGFYEFSDERVDFIRGSRILEIGLDGFYDQETNISPYPPLALLVISLIRLISPNLMVFKTIFFSLLLLSLGFFYHLLKRDNKLFAPLIMLGFITFPLYRLGIITLHPTDVVMLLFLLSSIHFWPRRKTLSFTFLGLSIALKWYAIFAAILFPLNFRKDKEMFLKSILLLWAPIVCGLLIPMFVFPNYANIYLFHSEKNPELLSWIRYSYGLVIPTLNLTSPLKNIVGISISTILCITSVRMTFKKRHQFLFLLVMALLPGIFFASTRYAYLRFWIFPFIPLGLMAKEGRNVAILMAAIPLFFFRYNILAVIGVMVLMLLFLRNQDRTI